MGNELEKIPDTEDYISFDFDLWLNQHDIKHLKDIFVEHNMCTLNSLCFTNKQFGSLITDDRLYGNKEMVHQIINGINSLPKIKKYTNDLDFLGDEFKKIDTKYKHKKLENSTKIVNYKEKCNAKLNQIKSEMNKSFAKFHEMLNQKESKLNDKILSYKNEINKIHIENENKVKLLDEKLRECQRIINDSKNINEDIVLLNRYRNDIMSFIQNNNCSFTDGKKEEIYSIKINKLFYNNLDLFIALHSIYDARDINTIKTFEIYDHRSWKVSSNKNIITPNAYNIEYLMIYGFSASKFLSAGYNAGIHKWSVKYCDGKKCVRTIGVTSRLNYKWTTKNTNGEWPKDGYYSYYDGQIDKPKWKKNEIITVVLDCINWIVYYYKLNQSNNIQQQIKQQTLQPNIPYYFALLGCTAKGYGCIFETVVDHFQQGVN